MVCCFFQFYRASWLWVLLIDSGDELFGFLPALFQAVAYHLPAVGLPAFPVVCLLKFLWRSAPCLSSFSGALSEFPSPLLCASFQFLVSCSVFFFFFFWQGSQFVQGTMLVYHRGGLGNSSWHLALTCSVCWMSPKQVWSWCLVVGGSPPVFLV
jgi:hypothetical protein